ncbi:undecaprenyldiphospho-muramoylpentapeptide beta-N-acetylglucosaminyltransferase [Alkalibacter rhizosphaerae]|uniref:UDP-N-acetylglucosamine--N-acetylmuramyl-(pentapeptide) pyrophosphoryl-undecaprenol N-acetylglucosamine transferase n=1 Tax=Alkalibacter rhizosphaerae TaxID=2815577 RepID=A0A975AIQ6_9FIRM|nr:undecaprenyldiphospho-muramoylpentapeptide beta-N-acetylglucosaminyltransferase [Alkalibacter rhizosphaerae]QSX08919.1 undecaprenyldiphospho-muramoylpentapeptide beta-N-acetylglucosaminyltransferase [Alkalibacter rhizosphaerae]
MKILIGAGGTGGHIYPGLALADMLKEKYPEADIRFVGTDRGMETTIVPNAGYPLETIRVKGFERKISMGTVQSIKELLLGMGDARKLLRSFDPDLVIGMGGYVCGPLLLLAARKNIPTVIHEQNAYPGATNRLLSRFVDKIGVSFPEATKWFPQEEKVFLCGNPVRKAFFQGDRKTLREKYGYGADDFIVLSVGGSLGATTLNNAVMYWLTNPPDDPSIRLIHITGKQRYDDFYQSMLDKGLDPDKSNWCKILSYSDVMHEIMALSDVAVSRAGAMSVAEIAASGIPAIFVPYPHATGNHQEFNAKSITEKGGGALILDADLKEEPFLLKNQLEEWAKHPEQLIEMKANVEKVAVEGAEELFYHAIKPLLERGQHER